MRLLVPVVILMIATNLVFSQTDKEKVLIAKMKTSDVVNILNEIGDKKAATQVSEQAKIAGGDPLFGFLPWSSKPPAYSYTSHQYGFLSLSSGTKDTMLRADARSISADESLKNQTIKVTLDRLRVFDYPGDGKHFVMFDFTGQHLAQNSAQSDIVHFNQVYEVQEGQDAGIVGYPVFLGLRVSPNGIAFRFKAINVKNQDDEKMLSFLNNDVFKSGLQMLTSVNPVLPVVTQFATGLAKGVGERNENIKVHDVDMGLDFSTAATRAILSQGSYIIVQADKWDWSKWRYIRSQGRIISTDGSNDNIPYNYFIFSVTKE